MPFRLDAESEQIIGVASKGVYVGVVHWPTKTVILYHAGPQASLSGRVVPGHQQLLELGAFEAAGHFGFSFSVKGGKLQAFYRNSILNLQKPRFCITHREMDGIIRALGLERADDFCSYP